MGVTNVDLNAALERYGLTSFRPGQAEVISNILAGHDCLCVMPTGGGKSLCYQLPALVRPGLTIVVSPLIALMKDQVDALQRRGISATLINSTLTGSEQNSRLQQVTDGKFSLVYVAPERLRNQRFMEAIRATPIQLLAIDEAHCISEWGHDFRPDYARIGQFREWLGGVQTIALTATATPRVRDDITSILKLRSPKQFVTGFARSNLHLSVVTCRSDLEKERQILDFLKTKPGFGIIYAATRKKCEELVEMLSKELKMSVGAYHAGLSFDQRRLIQEQFMKGELQSIVATNAFGMGIDKSDLRYVIHYNMPGSLEAYYQEAGRAGRDGKPSQCLMLFSYQDRYIHEFFIQNAYPPSGVVEDVYRFVLEFEADPIELTLQEIRDTLKLQLSPEAVGTSLQILARTGVLERLESGAGMAMVRISSDLPTLVDMLPKTSQRRRKVMRALERAVGDRRYEAVYVHPRWLMQHTDLDKDALHDALRELNKLEPIEYVPPFRGRATHVRRRDLSFSELNIDFKALQEKMKAELEKLDEVIAFAENKRCRQLTILQYFGDPAAAPCGLCDRCQNRVGWLRLANDDIGTSRKGNEKPSAAPVSSVPNLGMQSGLVAALLRKVLGGVQRTQGRLGKTLIAQFLTGSENQKVQRLRMERFPEFGMLKPLKQAEGVAILDFLLTSGLLEQREVNRHRPTLAISEVGLMVAQGKSEFPSGVSLSIQLQRKIEAVAKSTTPPSNPNPSTTSQPNSFVPSNSLSNNSQPSNSQPTHTSHSPPVAVPKSPAAPPSKSLNPAAINPAAITTNNEKPAPKTSVSTNVVAPTLVAPSLVATNVVQTKIVATGIAARIPAPHGNLASNRPSSPTGSEEKFSLADRFGSDGTNSATGSAGGELENGGELEAGAAPSIDHAIEDWYWSWRLADQGFALFECAAIRRKTMDSILRDLILAMEAGKTVSLSTLFDRETLNAARSFLENSSGGPLGILRRFGAMIPFLQVWKKGLGVDTHATSPS